MYIMGWNWSTYEITGGATKRNYSYGDLYSAPMALASTIFQDDYDATCEPEQIHAVNKRHTRILDANYKAADLSEIIKCISTIDDIEKHSLLGLLRKYENLFDGNLGNFETSKVKLNLKEDAKPYHAKASPMPKIHHDTLKHEIERLVELWMGCSYIHYTKEKCYSLIYIWF
jgi:hypothetical protein